MEKTKRMTEKNENTLKELQKREIYDLYGKLHDGNGCYVFEALNHNWISDFTGGNELAPYPMLIMYINDYFMVVIDAKAEKYRLTAARFDIIYCQELEFDSVDDIYELIVKIKEIANFDNREVVIGTIREFVSNLSNNKPKKEEN